MKKAKKYIFTIIIAVSLLATVKIALSKPAKPAEQGTVTTNGMVTQTVKVEKQDLQVNVVASGTTVAENKTNPNYNYLKFEANVDEVDIAKLQKNRDANIKLNSFPDTTFTGKIQDIDDSGTVVNEISNFKVGISLPKDVQGIKAGMTGDVTILVNEKKNALCVPIEAINKNIDGQYYVVLSGSNEEKNIKIGLQNGEYVEVVEGLSEGDKVIISNKVENSANKSNKKS
jgi:HlyD family secretion protein